MMKVAIFFPCFAGDPDEYTDDNPFNLASVEREIAGDHPIRNSTEQVITGPTDDEFAQGYAPVDSARVEIGTISLHSGECSIKLRFKAGFSSYVDNLSRLALAASIERTLKGLDNVNSVAVETH